MIIGYFEGDRLIYEGRTRNGFTPATRNRLFFKTFARLEIRECPFANLPEARSGRWGQGLRIEDGHCRWLKPALAGQFEFVEWTPDNHLRHTGSSRCARTSRRGMSGASERARVPAMCQSRSGFLRRSRLPTPHHRLFVLVEIFDRPRPLRFRVCHRRDDQLGSRAFGSCGTSRLPEQGVCPRLGCARPRRSAIHLALPRG